MLYEVKPTYLNSIDDLLKLQAHMSDEHSAFVDRYIKGLKTYIEKGLPFEFKYNDHKELTFKLISMNQYQTGSYREKESYGE